MIIKEEFFKALSEHQKFNDAVDRISKSISGDGYSVYLYETDWANAEGNIFDLFLKSNFTEDAIDIIYWWLYEDVDKIIYKNIEKDLFRKESEESISVETAEQLWDFFKAEPELYFKDVQFIF